MKFQLHGSKLNGEFALVKLKGAQENAWLLIKHRDKYAKETDITAKDRSVVSGKTIAKMAKAPSATHGIASAKPRKDAAKKKVPSSRAERSEPSSQAE